MAAESTLSQTDQAFLLAADQFAGQEIAASHLATSRASATGVQVFGKQMVEDYVGMHKHIEKVAGKAGVRLPEMDQARKEKVETLTKLSGSEFDRQYVSDEITSHTAAVELFEKAASSITDADLKKWAEKRLKTVRENLQNARSTLSKI
jgi:putative membrane protein